MKFRRIGEKMNNTTQSKYQNYIYVISIEMFVIIGLINLDNVQWERTRSHENSATKLETWGSRCYCQLYYISLHISNSNNIFIPPFLYIPHIKIITPPKKLHHNVDYNLIQ